MTTKEALEIEQIRVNIEQMRADTTKLQQEIRFPPIIVAAMIATLAPSIALLVGWSLGIGR